MKPTTTINSITLFILCVCLSVPAVSQQSVTDSLSFYRTIVDSPQDAEDLVKANQFFEKHSREAKAAGDFVIAAHDDFQLARIYYRGGFYDESETLAVKVLELLDTMPQDAYILDFKKSVYNHLGMLYRENYHEPRAIKMYKNALSLAPNASDSAIVYNNISNVYKDIEKYDIAKTELLHAYDLLPRIKDTLREALIVDNMGYLNFKLKDTSALSFFNTALKLRLKVNDTLSTFSSYQNLSEYYKAQDTGKAMGYALRAYDLSDIIKNPFYKEKALRLLADLNANRYYDAYINFRDSIDNAQKKAVNKFASLKYDVSKSELMAEREKSKRIRYQIIFLIALSISLLAIVWIRAVAKKKRLLQVYNTETRISKKVHDEIANDVYQVMSYIQTTSKPNEALLDDLETIYNKTRDISKENTPIDMDQNFDAVLKDLLLVYQSQDTTITTLNSEKVNWHKLSHTKKHSVYRVLQELMTNMKKHSKATNVLVSFSQKRSKIQITYKDNGIGCELHKQTGLQNAENRIKAIKGTITFDSEPQKGFQATLLV